jgi:hypothetical protein
MGNKEWKFHFIYRTENIKTGRYYIGMHSTSDINDGYLGSGSLLKKSVQYHGREYHERTILEYCSSREELMIREGEIINDDVLNDPKCMNISPGGGGFEKIEYCRSAGRIGNENFKKRLKEDKEFRKIFSEKISKSNKDKPRGFCKNPEVGTKAWIGKAHKEETKSIIGEKNSIRQKGNKNSQFGTLWVNKEGIDKKIKEEEIGFYLKNGWAKGRNLKMSNRKLDNSQVKKIKDMIKNKISQREIAKKFNVSKGTIQRISDGRSYS